MKIYLSGFFVLLLVANCGHAATNSELRKVLQAIKVPPGFNVSIFADNVPNVRTLAYGDQGIVYAGSMREGKVYAVQDSDHDGKAEKTFVIASGLHMPNGVAFNGGALYVAEINRILRYDDITRNLSHPPAPGVVYDQFPDKIHHGWKYLRFGPDGNLYTAVGAPCNICNPEQQIFTSLVRLNPDGSNFDIIARGIRNTVGFDWQPESGDLFFSENGRDYLGDDLPPEELNKWSKKGEHFGYPFCHGGKVLDPEFGKGKNCKDYVPPVWTFKAHMAPLGIRFYRGDSFPETYHRQLFVAEHGSWNRSVPHGYRIVAVKFNNGEAISEQVFADGWLTKDGAVLGRPTDILEMPDGSLLVSDDQLGVIYRISYQIKNAK